MDAFDVRAFLWINALAGKNPILDALGVFLGQYGIFALAALMLLWFFMPRQSLSDRLRLAHGAVAAALGLVVNYVIAHIWYRPRPFILYPHLTHLLVQHAADSSFPSDHATAVFAAAAAMAGGSKRLRRTLWIFAWLIGCARVFIGVHWPTDILAGLVIGSLAATLALGLRHYVDPLVLRIMRLLRIDTGENRTA